MFFMQPADKSGQEPWEKKDMFKLILIPVAVATPVLWGLFSFASAAGL